MISGSTGRVEEHMTSAKDQRWHALHWMSHTWVQMLGGCCCSAVVFRAIVASVEDGGRSKPGSLSLVAPHNFKRS